VKPAALAQGVEERGKPWGFVRWRTAQFLLTELTSFSYGVTQELQLSFIASKQAGPGLSR